MNLLFRQECTLFKLEKAQVVIQSTRGSPSRTKL
jgi:hypothetical protein